MPCCPRTRAHAATASGWQDSGDMNADHRGRIRTAVGCRCDSSGRAARRRPTAAPPCRIEGQGEALLPRRRSALADRAARRSPPSSDCRRHADARAGPRRSQRRPEGHVPRPLQMNEQQADRRRSHTRQSGRLADLAGRRAVQPPAELVRQGTKRGEVEVLRSAMASARSVRAIASACFSM